MTSPKRQTGPELTLAQRLRNAVGSLWGGRSAKGNERPSDLVSKSGDKQSSKFPASPSNAPVSQEVASERAELERMRSDLTNALDARPNNRKALPHLAVIHESLNKTGLKVFDRAPLAFLTKANEQLSLLASVHSELSGGALMRILGDSIARRGQDVTVVDDVAWRAPRDSDLMVTEGRMSDFMASNEGNIPPTDPHKAQP